MLQKLLGECEGNETLYSFYIQDRVICNQLQWTEKIELGMDLGEGEREFSLNYSLWLIADIYIIKLIA